MFEKRSSVEMCHLIDIPKIADSRGNLSFVQNSDQIPFDIKRVYYLYDIPSGAERGGHAHRDLEQLMIAIAGSFDVHVDDGRHKRMFHLNRPNVGLYIPRKIWRHLDNFSSGAVCINLASDLYSEDDYFRDYQIFLDHQMEY